MTADKSPGAAGRRHHAALGRADVGDGRPFAGRLEHGHHLDRQLRDRCGDDADVCVGNGLLERRGGGDGIARDRSLERSGSGS